MVGEMRSPSIRTTALKAATIGPAAIEDWPLDNL